MALRNKDAKILHRFIGETGDPKKFCFQAMGIILICLIGLWQLKLSFIAQLEMNKGAHIGNFTASLTDPNALAQLARQEHLARANIPRALQLYRQALENFVLHAPSWLGIAEIYNDQGKTTMGIKALGFVNDFAENNQDRAWTKTLLAHSLGSEVIMSENLVWLAENHPQKRPDVFALASLTWEAPQTLLEKFNPQYYPDILNVYIQNDEITKTLAVWEQVRKFHEDSPDIAVKYINYLLAQNEYRLAADIWRDSVNREGSLLYNGKFEKPILGSAFGWRISNQPGMSWRRGEYGSGMEIAFDGTENVVFQLTQIVPLEPGNYVFSGTYETDSLTTDQRPYWTISGMNCSGLHEQSEMLPDNAHPTEFIVRFSVPQGCETVQISLRRNKSFYFDNKLAGRVIINDLDIINRDIEAMRTSISDTDSTPGAADTFPNRIFIKELQTQ